MKYLMGLMLVLTFCAGRCLATPIKKVFPADCNFVWFAAQKAAVPPEYDFIHMDDDQKTGFISTRKTGKIRIVLTVQPKYSCEVSLTYLNKKFSHEDGSDLFRRIEEVLYRRRELTEGKGK